MDGMVAQRLMPQEVERHVESLRPFNLSEVGSPAWKTQRHGVEELNQTSHHHATEKKDDYVLSSLLTWEKLPVLINELVVMETYRRQVFPCVKGGIIAAPAAGYVYCYYEGIIVNLLECLLFHEEAVVGCGDDVLELIDYCWRHVTATLIADEHINDVTTMDAKEEMTLEDDTRFDRQQRELDIRRALSCVSILWFIVDRLPHLPLAVTNRVFQTHDLPAGFARLLEGQPWMRRGAGGYQKFVAGSWRDVSRQDSLLVCPPEAHAWFVLHFVLCNREYRTKYQFTQAKKDAVLRVKRLLNELIVDQIPALEHVQRALEELTLMEAPTGTEEKFRQMLVIEQIPRVAGAIKEELRGEGLARIQANFREHLASRESNMEDALRISKLFDTMAPEE